MEYLDAYDENKNFLGKKTRDEVHANGLWHNTVHCWLCDDEGNIYFQIKENLDGIKTFYTTASGHVLAGENIKEAFGREIKEELSIAIDYERAELVDIVIWKMDKKKEDGTLWSDRAWANVYVYKLDNNAQLKFGFDDSETYGIVKVNAKKTLELFKKGEGQIPATIITDEKGKNITSKRDVDFGEFLVYEHETALGKYGDVLNKVIAITAKAE